MSTTIINNPKILSVPQETQPAITKLRAETEIEFAKCECCGITEECTPAYIERVRERYHGKWICGLCTEAIKDEIGRSQKLISAEEATSRHMSFCKKFISSEPPPDATMHLISAMRHIIRRSLDSPGRRRSNLASPAKTNGDMGRSLLTRSESCLPTLAG